eukprot:CAMPEP_0197923564 /NCGR_PEP_ID=MMETSP1439-20131203/94202_1 /TAXON_ID=66791 /ORGANISM="Gonyaulax spinifera, Strain CCMP409" /LENGTH=69 /DNA_ID=CAMNT_0043545943 /DNA_START=61 /DNA_END=267 /DNA_ORIENTATION=+
MNPGPWDLLSTERSSVALYEAPTSRCSSSETGAIGTIEQTHWRDTRRSCLWKSTRFTAGTSLACCALAV